MLPTRTDSGRRRRPAGRLARGLLIPVLLAAVLSAAAPGWITIKRGDTLSELARRHHTTVAALQELNDLPGTLIITGQRLRVSAPAPAAVRRSPARPAMRTVTFVHVVKRGDSLIRIARRYGASAEWIARRNKLPRSRVVRLGARLVIGVRRVGAAPAKATPPARTRGGLERVSKSTLRAMVLREARKAGIDPYLALALAYQESGLQQHVVSRAGAIGTMQVMPGTADWIERYLLRRPIDVRRAADNVAAGVAYLAQLLRIAKNREQALAGYYQGLASVRRRGMYTDTKAYVRNILALRRRLAG